MYKKKNFGLKLQIKLFFKSECNMERYLYFFFETLTGNSMLEKKNLSDWYKIFLDLVITFLFCVAIKHWVIAPKTSKKVEKSLCFYLRFETLSPVLKFTTFFYGIFIFSKLLSMHFEKQQKKLKLAFNLRKRVEGV